MKGNITEKWPQIFNSEKYGIETPQDFHIGPPQTKQSCAGIQEICHFIGLEELLISFSFPRIRKQSSICHIGLQICEL